MRLLVAGVLAGSCIAPLCFAQDDAVIITAPRFPDVLAEITRAQPLTMLAVAFIAGMFLAWRR